MRQPPDGEMVWTLLRDPPFQASPARWVLLIASILDGSCQWVSGGQVPIVQAEEPDSLLCHQAI